MTLKQLLSKSPYSQKELALRVGVTESCLSQYRKGNREPSYSTAAVIAMILNCELGIEKSKWDFARKQP